MNKLNYIWISIGIILFIVIIYAAFSPNTRFGDTATPAVTSGKVIIKSHSKNPCAQYVCEEGGYYIVGEVVNNDSKSHEFIRISATYYDKNGKVVGSDNTFSNNSNQPLLSNQASSFKIFNNSNVQYDNYKLDVTYR